MHRSFFSRLLLALNTEISYDENILFSFIFFRKRREFANSYLQMKERMLLVRVCETRENHKKAFMYKYKSATGAPKKQCSCCAFVHLYTRNARKNSIGISPQSGRSGGFFASPLNISCPAKQIPCYRSPGVRALRSSERCGYKCCQGSPAARCASSWQEWSAWSPRIW